MAQLEITAGDNGSRKSGNGLRKSGVMGIVPAPGAASERLCHPVQQIDATLQRH